MGGVGPSRSPVPLLDGFALHVKKNPHHRLYFVGAQAKYVEPEITARGLGEAIQVLPFTDNVKAVFQMAGILVSIDTNVKPALFTPTKIVEYMVTDRPILSITPKDSPVDRLLSSFQPTAITVTDYSPDAVARGMEEITQTKWNEEAYRVRLEAMHEFSPTAISEKFETIVASVIYPDIKAGN